MAHFREFVLVTQLKAIAQRSHVRVLITLKLEALRDGAHRQCNNLSCSTSLKTQPEIPRVFGVDAESVRRSIGVGIDVSR